MNKSHRWLLVFVVMLMPAMSAMAQSTPEAASGEPTPFAQGLNTPATYTDIRGNPVFSISVTGVERDWQGYEQYSAPEASKEYVAVSLTVTNLTSRASTVSPYMIQMLDSTGMLMEQAYLYEVTDIWVDDISVPAGESVEGTMLFLMYTDLEPMMLMWQPEYGVFVMVYLGED